MNIETLHGENSIHILNQIIVQSPANDEIKFGCINDLCDSVVSALDALKLSSLYQTRTKSIQFLSSYFISL